MFGRNFEDLIKTTTGPRLFDEEFFSFNDKLWPWTTVYRFLFLADFESGTQLMIGLGQKNQKRYKVNGRKMVFSNGGEGYRMGLSYWLEKGGLTHKSLNERVDLHDGITTESFRFQKNDKGYNLELDDLSTEVQMDDKRSTVDYIRFKIGYTPFYRHNKYLSFTGRLGGETVNSGLAFIQKVYLNMPFIPWRWGRVFFEDGARFDYYEPRLFKPLFRSINFEVDGRRLEFKFDQKLLKEDQTWIISASARTGEKLKAKIRSYEKVDHIFETPRSTFVYSEMPSTLEDFTITLRGKTLYNKEDMGRSVANCEDARYVKPRLPQYF